MKKDNGTRSKIYEQYYPYPIPFNPEEGIDVFSEIPDAPQLEDVDMEFKKAHCYNQTPTIMADGVDYPYTEEHELEIIKCESDVLYFIVNYCKIVTLDGGMELFKMFQYQKNAIKVVHENRFSIFKFPRQMGKCVTGKSKVTVRINGEILKISIADLYSLIEVDNRVESFTPNEEYQILTQDGFKDFDGVTTRYSDHIIEFTLSDNTSFSTTENHEIRRNDNTYVKAKDLVVGTNVGIDRDVFITSILRKEEQTKVADMISVKDTASFIVNDMSAILSNCIDGDSMVTLLDNHTGQVFSIHVDELYSYLEKGATHE